MTDDILPLRSLARYQVTVGGQLLGAVDRVLDRGRVVLVSAATGCTWTAKIRSDAHYFVLNAPAGAYRLEASDVANCTLVQKMVQVEARGSPQELAIQVTSDLSIPLPATSEQKADVPGPAVEPVSRQRKRHV